MKKTKSKLKTIVCYGDSNTWGAVPGSDLRYDRNTRWPSALQKILGENFEVTSEGLCGRTFVAVDPTKPHRTGITHLVSILQTHEPIDLLIIMLGTNDIKTTYKLAAADINKHLKITLDLIRKTQQDALVRSKILVICPPTPIKPTKGRMDPRMKNGFEIFKTLPNLFKQTAKANGCYFLNAGDFITSSLVDGYHLEKSAHIKLAKILEKTIRKIL